MTLGEKLKEARKQAGLSQEQLSEKLGVSRSAVAKWETDNGIPDVDNQNFTLRVCSLNHSSYIITVERRKTNGPNQNRKIHCRYKERK